MARGATIETDEVVGAPRCAVRLSGSSVAPRLRGRIHQLAFVAALPGGAALVWHERNAAVLVYAIALVALYAVSAAYHLLKVSERVRANLRRADHSMIYVFTAAAYTPFCLRVVPGAFGIAVLALVWTGAAAGVAIKVFRFDRAGATGSILYICLGWVSVVTLPDAARVLSAMDLALVLAMGVFYTGGAAVLLTRRPDPVPHLFGYHEVWHTAVVVASICYFAVLWGLGPGG